MVFFCNKGGPDRSINDASGFGLFAESIGQNNFMNQDHVVKRKYLMVRKNSQS